MVAIRRSSNDNTHLSDCRWPMLHSKNFIRRYCWKHVSNCVFIQCTRGIIIGKYSCLPNNCDSAV